MPDKVRLLKSGSRAEYAVETMKSTSVSRDQLADVLTLSR